MKIESIADPNTIFKKPKQYVPHVEAFTPYRVPFSSLAIPMPWSDQAADLGATEVKLGLRIWSAKGREDRKTIILDFKIMADSMDCSIDEAREALNELAEHNLVEIKYADDDAATVVILLDKEWLHNDPERVKRKAAEKNGYR